MKKITLSSLLFVFTNLVIGQNAFYETQLLTKISSTQLQNILDASDQNKVKTVDGKTKPYISLSLHEVATLKDYKTFLDFPFDSLNSLDLTALQSSISKYNDYVESEKQNALYGSGTKRGIVPLGLGAALSFIPNILGGKFSLSPEQQTKIIDGLTKYYAEEFRKAQLLTYMQTFENTLGKVGELQVLLPQTYSKLKSADPSKFPELGDEYKTIFNEDLKALPDNLINHIDIHCARECENPNPELESKLKWLTAENCKKIRDNDYYTCFKLSSDIGSKLINNYHPVDLFNFIDNKYYSKDYILSHTKNSEKIILLLHGLNIIQRNLLDTTKSKTNQFANVWLNFQDFKAIDTKDEWKYFAALIYQQDKTFFNHYIFDVAGAGKLTDPNFDTIIANIKIRINAIQPILIELQNFRTSLIDENIKENFASYMNLVLQTITASNYFTKVDLHDADLKKYFKVATYTMNIYDNARKKDYNNTIYYAVEILNELLATDNKYLEVINTIENYGSFMTDVINAKNSDEVKESIKKHAAPPTSFILKREFQWTVSITGQPGYFISTEKLDGSNQKLGFVSGITLPMGFDATIKTKHSKENSGSIGVFLQILDLGAVLNFRVSDSTSTLPDKIEFQQIFSPGGAITYGFKNSPLTIGIGYQYTPQLRKITLDNGNETYPNGHRIFLRLAWDIPFINITKSKYK